MSNAWIPGAGRVRAAVDGGPLKGGAPRAVWQTLGADPRLLSARSAAQRLDKLDRACHLLWNPLNGEIVQLIPIVRAGRSLGWPEGLDPPGTASPEGSAPAARAGQNSSGELAGVNGEGRVCVQICVVGFSWEPFTSGPLHGLASIVRWLDSWGISRNWPAGHPAAFPHGHATCRSRRLWARGGHFGASQVPDTTVAGPGAIDVDRLTGLAAPGTARFPRAAAGEIGQERGQRQGPERTHGREGRQDGREAASGPPGLDDVLSEEALAPFRRAAAAPSLTRAR